MGAYYSLRLRETRTMNDYWYNWEKDDTVSKTHILLNISCKRGMPKTVCGIYIPDDIDDCGGADTSRDKCKRCVKMHKDHPEAEVGVVAF